MELNDPARENLQSCSIVAVYKWVAMLRVLNNSTAISIDVLILRPGLFMFAGRPSPGLRHSQTALSAHEMQI